jgi:hypothetical protein
MMERRNLLQALAALPAAIVHLGGKEAGRAYGIDPSKKYVVFVDPSVVDIDAFCHECHAFPPGTPVHCVAAPGSLDEAIRIYEVG